MANLAWMVSGEADDDFGDDAEDDDGEDGADVDLDDDW